MGERGGEAGGGSEGAREDLEEGETRDEAEDDNERRWGFKGEKCFIGLWTNHARHQLALTQQHSLKIQVCAPSLNHPWGVLQGPRAWYPQQREEVEAGVS